MDGQTGGQVDGVQHLMMQPPRECRMVFWSFQCIQT